MTTGNIEADRIDSESTGELHIRHITFLVSYRTFGVFDVNAHDGGSLSLEGRTGAVSLLVLVRMYP
jgi:hypothetical protein